MSRKKYGDEVPTNEAGSVLEDKIKTIQESRMPEQQKAAYIEMLTPKNDENVNRIPFAVYVKIRKIRKTLMSGMIAFPAAKGVTVASLEEWDEIYKNF